MQQWEWIWDNQSQNLELDGSAGELLKCLRVGKSNKVINRRVAQYIIMDDLINMVAGNESPTDIHSKIKDLLTKKASDNVDVVTPAVTASMFGGPNPYLDEPPTETDEVSPEAEVSSR